MDPDACLQEILDLTEAIVAARDASDEGSVTQNGEVAQLADKLAAHIDALHGWLSKRGALPEAWARGRKAK